RWHAGKLHQIADDESDLRFVWRLSVLQSVVIPDVDRPIRAGLKTQMAAPEHVNERAERFAEINGPDAGVSLGRKNVIDQAAEQYALASSRRGEGQCERRRDQLAVEEIDADELARRERKKRVRARRAFPFGFGRDERRE